MATDKQNRLTTHVSDKRGLVRLTAKKKRQLCEHIRETGNVSAACALVGISTVTAYAHRKKDTAFAEMWHEAKEAVLDSLEAALKLRAVEGVERVDRYKGEEVGRHREFSDTAAIFLLKGGRPEKYRESRSTAVTINDNRQTAIVGMSDAQLEKLIANDIGEVERKVIDVSMNELETGDIIDD